MEQSLERDENYKKVKEESTSIELIKMLERICYNYQSHELLPLGAWEAIDRLGLTRQPDRVLETDHYEAFKAIIEVCKASGINFAVLCSSNVDMAMKTLFKAKKITNSDTYKDGTYFRLSRNERKLVNDMAEDICQLTRFL